MHDHTIGYILLRRRFNLKLYVVWMLRICYICGTILVLAEIKYQKYQILTSYIMAGAIKEPGRIRRKTLAHRQILRHSLPVKT